MKIHIPEKADYIINTLIANNFEAYVVGGCVRDVLLNLTPNDWDITTNALPDEIISIFKHTIPTGIKHGTICVMVEDESFDVTTYRIDGEYRDNRHPDNVIFTTSIESDLSRRDFTINAMAYNNISGLIDPFNGLNDLENKIISCVGNPHLRFSEDGLRMLRAIRFSSQLGFNIEKPTFDAISSNHILIKNISFERIREELSKILLCQKPSVGIIALKECKLLHYIIPELIDTIGFNQKNPHHTEDVFHHILSVLDNCPQRLIVRLAALLHDIGKPECFSLDENDVGHFYGHEILGSDISKKTLKRLRYDNDTIKKVSILIKEHMHKFSKLSDTKLKKFMLRVGIDNLDSLFELQIADIKACKPPHDFENIIYLKNSIHKILTEEQPLKIKDLNITGADLIKLGFKPGKAIGDMLDELLDVVLQQPDYNDPETLITHVKNSECYRKLIRQQKG